MACKHTHTSLVEMTHKEFGEFLTVQCDVCGDVLPRRPIDDDTLIAWECRTLRVPRMDYPAYAAATDRAWRDVLLSELAPLVTFADVVGKR